MKIIKKTLPIESIQLNEGQIKGLPKNPRKYSDEDIVNLAKSLKETPELLEIRCPIVVPVDKNFITLGGNRRVEAARKNEEKTLTCYVLSGASVEKMKEIVIKDNGSFGDWDTEMLKAEWKDVPLLNWGIKEADWGEGTSLPPELEGKDLNPDDLPEEEGEGETANDRIIIVFHHRDADKVAKKLGLGATQLKIIYKLSELPLFNEK